MHVESHKFVGMTALFIYKCSALCIKLCLVQCLFNWRCLAYCMCMYPRKGIVRQLHTFWLA